MQHLFHSIKRNFLLYWSLRYPLSIIKLLIHFQLTKTPVCVLLSLQSNADYICITIEIFPGDFLFINISVMDTLRPNKHNGTKELKWGNEKIMNNLIN